MLPRVHRIGASDLILSLVPLSSSWALTLTLSALFSSSSVALSSVARSNADYKAAFTGVSPTIVLSTAETMAQTYQVQESKNKGIVKAVRRWIPARALKAGNMPKTKSLPHPRLIYIQSDTSAGSPPLSVGEAFELRLHTGSYLVLALTTPKVAGAIAQTNPLDYQNHGIANDDHSHFGPPLSCVEIQLNDTENQKNTDDKPLGWLLVSGPAVAGGEIVVDRVMTITESNTLAYNS